MKTSFDPSVTMVIGLTLLSCGPALSQETWIPIGAPTITNSSLQTVGGITYLTHTSRLHGCRRVACEPVVRTGTNLTQTISEEQWTGFCLCDTVICDPFAETHVSVLGNLPPGDYALRLYGLDIFNPGPPLWPFAVMLFQVPVSEPTLSTTISNQQFVVSVAGVAGVRYTIEVSVDFANWTPVYAKIGGPFNWTQSIASSTDQRFYRVRIEAL